MGIEDSLVTYYSVVKKSNSEKSAPAGSLADIEQTLCSLRSQNEESYKRLLAPIISFCLNSMVYENDKKPIQKALGGFNATSPPEVSIGDYLARIIRYTPCSAECFLVSLILIDRIVLKHGFRVNSYNVHRLLLTTIMLSAKLVDDTLVNNKYYSHVGGISIKELNSLECKLLSFLDYDLNVLPYTFELYRYESELQLIHQLQEEGEDRSNLCFQDDKTMQPPNMAHILKSQQLRRSRSFHGEPMPRTFKRKNRSTSYIHFGLVTPTVT
eukprot:TRINITY_DN7709_c0_g1_i1.p1 TRINITY_DN7709_c0_g1~~TRINITY_DN7709_c0_g1_i1.p1  ORF type:complete len:269 (-),score=38.24 TRINITY_DN7709_c0_g1_i1:111-917(-)